MTESKLETSEVATGWYDTIDHFYGALFCAVSSRLTALASHAILNE